MRGDGRLWLLHATLQLLHITPSNFLNMSRMERLFIFASVKAEIENRNRK